MIECRVSTPEELSAVARLRAQMAQEMGGDWDIAHPGWRTRFMEFFGGKQSSGRSQIFVAADGDNVVGLTIVSILTDDYRAFALNLPRAHVNAVFVKPEYRRQGIARRLMRLAIDWSRSNGCVRVFLRTSEDGRSLYESMGFKAGREMELGL